MSGNELSEFMSGATVEINAPLGYKLPVKYLADGQVKGEAGGLSSYLGSATDSGKWWVRGDLLCHKWKQWFSGEIKCLRLAREGRTIHWTSQDGDTGTAELVAQAPRIEVAAAAMLPTFSPLPRRAATPPVPEAAPLPVLLPPEPKPVRSGIAPADPADPETAATPEPAGPPPASHAAAVPPASAVKPAATAPQAPKPRVAQRSPKSPPEPAYRVANIGADDMLNMRSGPSTDYAVVAALLPDSRGVVITGDCQSDWCPVRHATGAGWVNRSFLKSEAEFVSAYPPQRAPAPEQRSVTAIRARATSNDSPQAPRSCLTQAARRLLERIEEKFGAVRAVSTCRAGATIADSGRPSRHASGNAIDFDAGGRKSQILNWLIANHRAGGVMTYANMDHIHVDIGPHFVSIAGGQNYASWRGDEPSRSRNADNSDDD